MSTDTAPAIINGLNTATLNGLIDLLKQNPASGRVTFVANSAWQDGARSFTSYMGYRIDGQMQHQHQRRFVVLVDEPTEFGATDAAPGPVETLMAAVGSCIAATTNANAALMGITLTRLEVALESDLDLHGIFALDPNVRPGLGALRTTIRIAGDADATTLRSIAQRGYSYSPVRDTVAKGVAVQPQVEVAI